MPSICLRRRLLPAALCKPSFLISRAYATSHSRAAGLFLFSSPRYYSWLATMHDGEGPAAAAMRKMQDGAGASATGASMASALRVSSAAEPPEISETDKFLFTYLGHRSPVVPLGVRCCTCQASTAGAQGTAGLTLMAPRPCARGRLRNYSGHSGLGLQPIQGWQQEGVAVLYAGARHCPGKRQRQRTP